MLSISLLDTRAKERIFQSPLHRGNLFNVCLSTYHSRTAGYINLSGKEKRRTVTGTEFQLTHPSHFKHHKNVRVASLRS